MPMFISLSSEHIHHRGITNIERFIVHSLYVTAVVYTICDIT